MELLLNLMRKGVITNSSGALSELPRDVVLRLQSGCGADKSDPDTVSERVRELVVAYNASMGEDASVISLDVQAIHIGDHKCTVSPPCVDMGRRSLTFYGTGPGDDEEDEDLMEFLFRDIRKIQARISSRAHNPPA